MSKVIEVTDQNFEEEITQSDLPTEVDFWAPWCGPCRMVSPIYDKLADEYDGRFKFCKINVDEHQAIAGKYQVMSIPMQMFFVDGKKVDEILGAVPERSIRAKVDAILESAPADDKDRLKAILSSWAEQNKKHGERLEKLAKKAGVVGDDAAYRKALEAGKQVEKANEELMQALTQLERS